MVEKRGGGIKMSGWKGRVDEGGESFKRGKEGAEKR